MKKHEQLGMNPSTASNRLVKDILFQFIHEGGIPCFRCEMPMTRQNFSIEHKTPWLDSENPRELFFDLSNIAFSHLKCNIEDRRVPRTAKCGTNSKYTSGCRCDACKAARAEYARKNYNPAYRKARYQKSSD